MDITERGKYKQVTVRITTKEGAIISTSHSEPFVYTFESIEDNLKK